MLSPPFVVRSRPWLNHFKIIFYALIIPVATTRRTDWAQEVAGTIDVAKVSPDTIDTTPCGFTMILEEEVLENLQDWQRGKQALFGK
jgi:hypothetical protein